MIGIISVTKKGDVLGYKLKENLEGTLYLKSSIEDFSLKNITEEAFKKHKYIIFISSTGIAVRAIGHLLKGKDKDPGVVVVDVCNNFSISLVSGHLGGANKLTQKVSKILNNTPVITTATDNLGVYAPDMVAIQNKLIIDDLKTAKVLATRLVNKEEVYFKDDRNLIETPKGYIKTNEVKENTLWITNKDEEHNNVLKLYRKDIVLGVGCRRKTENKKFYNFIMEALKENNLSYKSIKAIASIDVKRNEECILNFASSLNIKSRFFTKEEISLVHNKYEGSDFVFKNVGVRAVAEPVVELMNGTLIVNKIKKDGMTLAIGIMYKEK